MNFIKNFFKKILEREIGNCCGDCNNFDDCYKNAKNLFISIDYPACYKFEKRK